MIFNIPQVSLEDNALQLHDEQQQSLPARWKKMQKWQNVQSFQMSHYSIQAFLILIGRVSAHLTTSESCFK